MSLLEVSQLSVARGGDPIVDEISFSIERGQVVGLIGPNGSGKSTTLGALLGFYPIHGGSFSIDEAVFDKKIPLSPEAKGQIAYIPEQPMYYPDLTLLEHLQWKQRLWHRYQDTDVERTMTDLIDAFELSAHVHKFPHQCSKGTLQKLMITAAFMTPFQLLVIDEPFIGLDIVSIRRLREEITQARTKGAGVLLSTHVLDAAEKMCSHFVLLHEGRTIRSGSLTELKAQAVQYAGTTDASLEDLFVDLVEQERSLQRNRGGSA